MDKSKDNNKILISSLISNCLSLSIGNTNIG